MLHPSLETFYSLRTSSATTHNCILIDYYVGDMNSSNMKGNFISLLMNLNFMALLFLENTTSFYLTLISVMLVIISVVAVPPGWGLWQ